MGVFGYFLSLAYHFSFLSPSLWNGWMDKLWFSDIRTMVGDGLLFTIKSHLRLRGSTLQAGLQSETARSAGHRLPTELPGLLSGETEDGSIQK